MRLVYIFAVLLGLSLAMVSQSKASEEMTTNNATDKQSDKQSDKQFEQQQVCRVETGDIGTIIGRGPAAFEDAATQCFDRRMQLYKARYGKKADMETGEIFIDLCANITCGK